MALVRGSTARSQRSGSPLFLPAYQLQAVQPMMLFIFLFLPMQPACSRSHRLASFRSCRSSSGAPRIDLLGDRVPDVVQRLFGGAPQSPDPLANDASLD